MKVFTQIENKDSKEKENKPVIMLKVTVALIIVCIQYEHLVQ